MVRRHWFILIATILYTVLLLSVIKWGIPNSERVFLYHMDEWHQLMSIRALVEHFTTTVEGAAHGAVFHFLVSGAFLGIFQILGIVNIFDITSSVANLETQEKIFVILRFSTLLYGLGAILVLYHMLRRQLQLSSYWIGVTFFIATPTWLSLSNYFKYDIALVFWLLVTLSLVFQFIENPSYKNYLFAGIAAGLSFNTKISAVPILVLYIISFFYGAEQIKNRWLTLINGVSLMLLIIFFLGVPDYLIGKADYSIIISDVVFDYPANSFNYIFGEYFWLYLLFNQFPINFGRPLVILFLVSLVIVFNQFQTANALQLHKKVDVKKMLLLHSSKKVKKIWITLISLLLFAVSLYPLKLFSSGNRMLVLLPFMVIILTYAIEQLLSDKKRKNSLLAVVFVAIIFQMIESVSWVSIKWQPDPREISSNWIEKHIPTGTTIGITHPLIYQKQPDIVMTDYFFDLEESIEYTPKYSYINVLETATQPDIVILTDLTHEQFKFVSPKYQLYERLLQNGYQTVIVFYPSFGFQKYVNDPLSFAIPNLLPTPLDITILANSTGTSIIKAADKLPAN